MSWGFGKEKTKLSIASVSVRVEKMLGYYLDVDRPVPRRPALCFCLQFTQSILWMFEILYVRRRARLGGSRILRPRSSSGPPFLSVPYYVAVLTETTVDSSEQGWMYSSIPIPVACILGCALRSLESTFGLMCRLGYLLQETASGAGRTPTICSVRPRGLAGSLSLVTSKF